MLETFQWWVGLDKTSQLNYFCRDFIKWICAIRGLSSGLNAAVIRILYASVNLAKRPLLNSLHRSTSVTNAVIQVLLYTLTIISPFS
jgi:hypothetical protein